MQTLSYNGNYFLRYAVCFAGSAFLYYVCPALLAWPLKLDVAFIGFSLFLILHPKSRTVCGVTSQPFKACLKGLHAIWLWQVLSLLSACATMLLISRLYPIAGAPLAWLDSPFCLSDLYAKLCVGATISTILACIIARAQRPLTIVPLFVAGSDATSPLVIFGNTWLRDASCTLGLVSFSVSVLVLLQRNGSAEPISPLIVLGSIILSLALLKTKPLQALNRRLCRSGHFWWFLLGFSAIFLCCLLLGHALLDRWRLAAPFFKHVFTAHLSINHATLLFQSLIMISIAPLIFRAAPLCQGMSVRTALLGQCLNPYFMVLALSTVGQSWLSTCLITLYHSTVAMNCIAITLLIVSLCYLGSIWFANLLERLFSQAQQNYQPRMRLFFSQRLLLQVSWWLMLFGLGLSGVAVIFISTVAAGTLLVYFYFYCFFWPRSKNFTETVPHDQHF